MNKGQLIEAVANATGNTKADAEKTVNIVLHEIVNGLKQDQRVQISGFGIFSVKERKERVGVNPQTGEKMTYPASRYVHFKGNALKEKI